MEEPKKLDLDALFFAEEHREVPIEINGNIYPFTVKGLTQFEVEEIASEIIGKVTLDPTQRKSNDTPTGPTIRINQGQFHQMILLKGVVRAPPGITWDDEHVRKLTSEVRDPLISAITALSDGMEAFKKK